MARNGSLHRRHLWHMMDVQFWPRVGYGIGTSSSSYTDLDGVLSKQYYELLPIGGVIRSAPKELRMLDIGFGGIGCPHPGIECLVEQLNKLAMHSSIGLALQSSMELFILELGLAASQPFSMPFKKYSSLITHCWLKSVWEKCDRFRIRVVLKNINIRPPREGDKWFMQALVDEGDSEDELRRLNRVRINQQVLFL